MELLHDVGARGRQVARRDGGTGGGGQRGGVAAGLEVLPLTEIIEDARQTVNELAEVTPHLGDSTPQRGYSMRAVGATCDRRSCAPSSMSGLLQRLADELERRRRARAWHRRRRRRGRRRRGRVDGARSAAPRRCSPFYADAVNEGDFELVYGDADDYHRGLERLVASPRPRLAGMRSDHLDGATRHR